MKKPIRKPREMYTREFKLEAVRLLNGGSKPAATLAMELGGSMGSDSIDR